MVVANLFIGSAKLHCPLIILLHATLTASTNVYVEVMSIPSQYLQGLYDSLCLLSVRADMSMLESA
jgi:hypothetical protein